MIQMNSKTKEQLDDDLPRVLKYANGTENLNQMCSRCERFCGKEHDYEECRDEPCFVFFRAFAFLDYYNTY